MKKTYSIGFILWLLLTAIIAFSYFFAVLHVSRTSDNAALLLNAQDILSGNFLLKYWHLGTDSYYTLEIPFYVLAMKILGFKPHLMYSLPALFYGVLASTASVMAFSLNKVKQQKYFSLLICLFLVAMPALVLEFAFHLVAIFYVLIAFWLFTHAKKFRTYFLSFIFLLLGNIGDPTSYFAGNIPLLLIPFLSFTPKEKKIHAIILSLGSLSLSFIIKTIITHYGFTPVPLDSSFVTFENFGPHIAYVFESFLALFNANIFGQSLLSLSTFLEICRLPLLLAGILLLVRFFKKMNPAYQQDYPKNGFLSLLAVASILNILFCLFANQFISTPTIPTARYLMPSFIFLSIFFAAEIPSLIKHTKLGILSLVFLLILGGIEFYHQAKQRVDEGFAKRVSVEKYLLEHHLTNGLGGYWDAYIFTVGSYHALTVLPIISDEKGILAPYFSYSNSTWYTPPNEANFLILEDNTGSSYNWGGVNLSSAIKTFGKPAQTISLNPYIILIWNKNIMPELDP